MNADGSVRGNAQGASMGLWPAESRKCDEAKLSQGSETKIVFGPNGYCPLATSAVAAPDGMTLVTAFSAGPVRLNVDPPVP